MQHTISTSRLRQGVLGLLLTALAAGSLLWGGAPAQAAPRSVAVGVPSSAVRSSAVRPLTSTWTVENSPGTWYASPTTADSSGVGLANGAAVSLLCYFYGAPAGPYGNTVWYYAHIGSTGGFINDHFLNTPGTAANPQLQAPHCNWVVAAQAEFTVENSPGTFSASPSSADNSGVGVGNGQAVYLDCYFYGAAAGPYGNTLWYLAQTPGSNGYYFINDHYLNTPGTAANPQLMTTHC